MIDKEGLKQLARSAKSWLDRKMLPAAARREADRDHSLGARTDPGIEAVLAAGIDWIFTAQDNSPDRDGGVARHYSLVSGWGHSYPETTGYIVPTLLTSDVLAIRPQARARAERMLDWFLEIQFPEGGFQGGMINATPRVPVTFNTGQILLGLAAGAREFGEPYLAAMRRAADWLCRTQDADGAWRRFPTPFAAPGEKTYETHVAWGLFEAARVVGEGGYARAALLNNAWALTKQAPNGWLSDCCLSDRFRPLTHTLGYALRGLVEAYRFSEEPRWLAGARRTADGIMSCIEPDGRLSGQLDANWRAAADYVCLTGSAQIAHSLLLLYRWTGYDPYLSAGRSLNRFVRSCVSLDDIGETRGGVKGSFPVDGSYGRFQYLNWAVKFLVDSCLEERDLLKLV